MLIAQDDLNILGLRTGGLDGMFRFQIRNVVIAYLELQKYNFNFFY